MPSTMEVLKALAARRAITFIEELGLRQATFEGDSEIVVKTLVGDCPVWSSIGLIVKDWFLVRTNLCIQIQTQSWWSSKLSFSIHLSRISFSGVGHFCQAAQAIQREEKAKTG
nr:hypothetical protein CFP56_48291 [Quercus suber]